jgi:hypothetical protein
MSTTNHGGERDSALAPDKRTEAVRLAAADIRVFPVHGITGDGSCTCGRVECPSPGKHPRTSRGFKDATTDVDQVAAWWAEWPDANIAMPTGDGVFAVDIDGAEGFVTAAQLEQRAGSSPPPTVEVVTGRGRHLYFATMGTQYPSGAGVLGPHVDIRADDGYVILPPSTHPSGIVYSYADAGRVLGRVDLPPAPDYLVPQRRMAAAVEVLAATQSIGEGERNTALTRIAGKLIRGGITGGELEHALQAINAARCKPPLDKAEVGRIAASTARYVVAVSDLAVEDWSAFAAVDEAGAEPIVGTPADVLFASGGDAMAYGDGGAGKTTLLLDLAFHLAAGDDWLGYPVPEPRRVLVIEGEGPRVLFRRKLRAKGEAWQGSPIRDGLLRVLAEPWAKFTFASERAREMLASIIREQAIDVVIAGPLTRLGMDEAGTLQQTRDFMLLIDDVRGQVDRPLAVMIAHHENAAGKVSGAWVGAGDTLLHVKARGNGHTAVHIQKARWAPTYHNTKLRLAWAPGAGFAVEDAQPNATELVTQVLEDTPGLTTVELIVATSRGRDKPFTQSTISRALATIDAQRTDEKAPRWSLP